MIFKALSSGSFVIGERRVACALGRNGVVAAALKREGDGKSPLGRFPLRRALYRSDRLDPPRTALPLTALGPLDGWCDAPEDPAYNRPVVHPYPASAERLWREDSIYDLIVVLGHNDDPVVKGLGSAIFLHVARPAFTGTEGCVALGLHDLLEVLRLAAPGDALEILGEPLTA